MNLNKNSCNTPSDEPQQSQSQSQSQSQQQQQQTQHRPSHAIVKEIAREFNNLTDFRLASTKSALQAKTEIENFKKRHAGIFDFAGIKDVGYELKVKDFYFPSGKGVIQCRLGKEINTILLGSTGNGKSTTGNFLMSLNNTKGHDDSLFKESYDVVSCTRTFDQVTKLIHLSIKDIDDYYDLEYVYNLSVIDTPGLNESEIEQEFKNTTCIIEGLSKIKIVNTVLLILDFSRMDKQGVESFHYYRSLMKNVFDTKNWAVVLTKIPDRIFKKEDMNAIIQTRKEHWEATLNVEIPNIYYFNPYSDNEKFKVHNSATLNDIHFNFLAQVNCSITGMLFPLPPQFEVIRTQTLKSISENMDTLRRIYQDDSNQISKNLRDMNENLTKIQDYEKQNSDELVKIQELSYTIFSVKKFHSGSSFIAIDDWKVDEVVAETSQFILIPESWNCQFNVISRVQHNNVTVEKYQYKPDRFNFGKLLGYRWYLKIALAFEGRTVNRDMIIESETTIAERQKCLEELKLEFEEKSLVIDEKSNSFKINFNQYNELYYLQEKILRTHYQKEKIISILHILLLLKQDKLTSLSYNTFPDFDANKKFKVGENILFYKDLHEKEIAEMKQRKKLGKSSEINSNPSSPTTSINPDNEFLEDSVNSDKIHIKGKIEVYRGVLKRWDVRECMIKGNKFIFGDIKKKKLVVLSDCSIEVSHLVITIIPLSDQKKLFFLRFKGDKEYEMWLKAILLFSFKSPVRPRSPNLLNLFPDTKAVAPFPSSAKLENTTIISNYNRSSIDDHCGEWQQGVVDDDYDNDDDDDDDNDNDNDSKDD